MLEKLFPKRMQTASQPRGRLEFIFELNGNIIHRYLSFTPETRSHIIEQTLKDLEQTAHVHRSMVTILEDHTLMWWE